MKRIKSYKFDEIIIKICKILLDDKWHTPSGISKEIQINPKTAQKYVHMGINLGFFVSDSFETSNTLLIKINPKYKEIFNELEKKNEK